MRESESLKQAISEEVRICPYDPAWPGKFEDEKTRLNQIFPQDFAAIEHIGSTAVPLLSAKPIIDLMAGVRNLEEADLLLRRLCEHDYTTSAEFNATLTDRRWLMRHAHGRRTHHLHLMIFEGPEWRRRLKFRDLLRTDPARARQYEELKVRLSGVNGLDREAYTAGKADFIGDALRLTPE